MALLSNINDKFAVDSTGAIQFNGQVGTSGYVLKSNANAAPTWVDPSTVIGGPYLPLTGGTLTGATATASGISFTVGGTLTGASATFVRDTSGYALRLDSPNATTDNDLRFAKGGTDYAAIQVDATTASDFQFYVNNGTNWINTLNFARADGQATFTQLVSGITPTAAANFATKAYVDAHPGSGGTVTSVATGNGLTGGTITTTGTLTMSGSYTGTFTIDSTGDVEYLKLNTTSTANKRVRLQFTQNDNAGVEIGTDYAVNNDTNFYLYDRVNANLMAYFATDKSYFPENVGIGNTSPGAKLTVGSNAHGNATGIEVSAGSSGANIIARDGTNHHNWFPYTDGNNYYSAENHTFRGGTNNTPNYMIINSSGNVGIGTISPGRGLTIDKSNEFASLEIIKNNTGNQIAYLGTGSSGPSDLGILQLKDNNTIAVQIYTGGDSWLNGGNVGIGTTAPTNGKFVINQNSSATSFGGNICQLFENFNTADGQMMSIGFRNNNSVGTTAYIDAVAYDQSIGATDIRFSTYSGSAWSSNMVTFQHTGRVGIGTTSPAEKLMVIGNIGLGDGTYNGGVYANSSSTTVDPNWGLEIQKTSGVTDWNTRLKYYPNSGNSRKAGIFDSRNNRFSLYSDTNNTPNIIIAYGNVGIGNTSPQTTLHVGTTTTVTNQFTNQVAASNFFVNGNANGGASFFQCKTAAVNINMMGNNDFACNQFTFYHKPLSTSQNIVGTITTFSSSTQYNTTSDYRLKENIIPLSDSITRLKQLKPSRFNFIEDPERTMDGFLAHEVQNIVPEAVNGEKDAIDENGNEVHQGIDQAKLVPLLVAAIQELEARVKELENK